MLRHLLETKILLSIKNCLYDCYDQEIGDFLYNLRGVRALFYKCQGSKKAMSGNDSHTISLEHISTVTVGKRNALY